MEAAAGAALSKHEQEITLETLEETVDRGRRSGRCRGRPARRGG
ncbi:hypothetical protein ACFWF3_20140, partial [Nocardia sp. NPDC060220]